MVKKEIQDKNKKVWAQIVAKAWMDPAFKTKLLSNPAQVCKESGMDTSTYTLRVIEAKKNEAYFILPAKPESKLSETELKNVAAAFCTGGENCGF